MLSYLENYRQARLRNWVVIPIILFSSMLLFFIISLLLMPSPQNTNNCYIAGFGVVYLCMDLFIAVKFVHHAATTRNLYKFLEEGDKRGLKFYVVLVFMSLIGVILCICNIPSDEILKSREFILETVFLIVIVDFLFVINFFSLKKEIPKFKNMIKSLSETEEQKLKKEIMTLKDYDDFRFTKNFLIKFTPFACVAIDYNDIMKGLVKYVPPSRGSNKGSYFIKIYDENSKSLGSISIMCDKNVKNDLKALIETLKLKCSNISLEFSRNFFWPR